ncbi:GNAT family N-acetyltransferase [Streptomyces sp. NBC_01497]|uniref:GNAT family N-acetyltransferase n=1 Tax=Streptomyces sp. NBC_01497 TaxID=2903885 RepID=UPI002E2F5201|nr:GNAT family N-acetyltransferase [Streptomyces sp. NBC_01497]
MTTGPATAGSGGTSPAGATPAGAPAPGGRAGAGPGTAPGAVPGPRGSAALSAHVYRGAAEFAALADEWDALFARCRTATPFQSHAWLHSWWLSYGTPGRLRIAAVRGDGGRLLALAPLTLTYRPFPVLVPLGGAITDFCDVLLDDAWADQAAVTLGELLGDLARGAVIDLREVRPGAAAERIFAQWQGPRRQLTDSLCLELPGAPVADLVGRLPSLTGQRVRAKLRKADKLGIAAHHVPEDEVPAAIGRLIELHGRQWAGRGVNPEHLSARFGEHLIRAVRAMTARGQARVTEFHLDGDLVVSDLTLISPRLSGGYLYGAEPALRDRKVDVSAILLRNSAEHFGPGTPEDAALSMLRGTEAYKSHWRPEPVRNKRLLLARPALRPALVVLVARAAARRAAARAVKRWRARGTSPATAVGSSTPAGTAPARGRGRGRGGDGAEGARGGGDAGRE